MGCAATPATNPRICREPTCLRESEVVTAPRGTQDGLRRANASGTVPTVEGSQADGWSVIGAVAGACLDGRAGRLGLEPWNGSRAAAPLARGNYVANENVDRRRSRLPRVETDTQDVSNVREVFDKDHLSNAGRAT